jgi:hypothetical protein
MYLSFQQITLDSIVKVAADFAVPANATQVLLQSAAAHTRFTCDNVTVPNGDVGMLIRTTDLPFNMTIDDFLRIKCCKDGHTTSAVLMAHFYAGRDI